MKPGSNIEKQQSEVFRKVLDSKIDKTIYKDLDPYVKEIDNCVNIFELGYPREAIGAIGRVLETSIDDFLLKASKLRKMAISKERIEQSSFGFHNKIEFLASERNRNRKKKKNITQSEKSKMLSVKWDRNIGDHPASEEEVKQMIRDSRPILELGINMIGVMKEKINELE